MSKGKFLIQIYQEAFDYEQLKCYFDFYESAIKSNAKTYLLAATAYGIWGILPIYWKMMLPASSSEVLAHRMVWSLQYALY